MHTIFTILVSLIKLTRKQTDFHQAEFCERLKTTNQLQKKFQYGNSVIEDNQLLGNVLYDGKKKS